MTFRQFDSGFAHPGCRGRRRDEDQTAPTAPAGSLSTMVVHYGLSVLVLQSFTRSSRRWLWLAIAVHTASNVAGVGAPKALGVWPGEAVIALFALVALTWTVRWVREDRRARASLSS
ncbi:MAG: YhfC family glutamic-type intramembrane protease [Myxococcaceae bacterium]|nr:YhfC family glutamic-type intramembrane protease [Myxococcaceae bacterium]